MGAPLSARANPTAARATATAARATATAARAAATAARANTTPALVLLAAGASRRLGACKALVPLTPRNPLELLSAAGIGFDSTAPLVIAGAHHDEIRGALPAGLELVFNPEWRTGQLTSVKLAHELRPGFDLCLAPVDVPLVPRAVFERLLETWRGAGSPAFGWLAPSCLVERNPPSGAFDRAYGHPVLVGRELCARLSEFETGWTLRDLRRMAEPLLAVEVASREVLDDLDTPEDFARLRARART